MSVRGCAANVATALALLALVGCGSDDDALPTLPPTTTSVASISAASTTAASTTAASTTLVESATTVAIPAATPNALGLAAVVDQFREDEIAHQMQIRVTNASATKVRLESMQLDWPGFTVVAPNQHSYLLSPGQTLDVPVDFGVAVCAQDPPGVHESTPSAPAVANAMLVPGDAGSAVADVIPIADRLHIFDRVFPSDCRDQRVASAVDIHFDATWMPTTRNGATGLAGTLEVVRRRAGPRVVLTRLDGSVLLVVHAATEAQPEVLALEPAARMASLPVVVVQSGNCSGHALTESKKTFYLPVQVSIDGEPSLPYELVLDPAVRPQFTTMINTSCAVG
ncbi:MAG: hypothetical protein ABIR68_17600 [Ilumatobacteraceae bacterium]